MEFKKFGKYTIIKHIASGGMAEILLAADPGTAGISRFVVVKRTLSRFSDSEEFKGMFKNEGRIACNLNHRNITPIYEFGIEDSKFFLAMEYISGRNLRQVLKKASYLKTSIATPLAIYIIKEAASGLNYAHNAIDSNTGKHLKLIHRDVSPQNILINFTGEIKLIDFGIAKLADTNLTQAGHLKGKFGYMSPEQASGDPLDTRADIFSLGIILWELLANKRLFSFKNEMITLKKIKACEIPDLKKINPKISNELLYIVNKALSKNQNLRYKAISQMEKDLTIFLNTNYPHFSQYDLESFMRESHEKEILKEREQLNKYAKELEKWSKKSKYKNEEGVHEQELSKNLLLNMPDVDEENTLITTVATESSEDDDIASIKLDLEPTETSTELEETDTGTTSTTHGVEHDESTGKIQIIKENQFANTTGLDIKSKSISQTSESYTNSKRYNSNKKENKKYMVTVIASLAVSAFLIFGGIFTVMNLDKIANHSFIDFIYYVKTSKMKELLSNKSKKATPDKKQTTGKKSKAERRTPASIKRVFFETKPSGAYLIFKNRKYITPIALQIPTNTSFAVIIKKEGYISKRLTAKSGRLVSSHLKIHLKRDQSNPRSITIID